MITIFTKLLNYFISTFFFERKGIILNFKTLTKLDNNYYLIISIDKFESI